jgi:hypothetical protein
LGPKDIQVKEIMTISAQQFKDAYAKLPYILREYIADDEMATIANDIGKKYGFHVDTVGALYREATNMLAGLETPEQFTGELKSVGVPAEIVTPIVQELNERVFIPLRERMQKEGDRDPYKESEALDKELEEYDPSPSQAVSAQPVVSYAAPTLAPLAPVYAPQPAAPIPSYSQAPIAPASSVSQYAAEVPLSTGYSAPVLTPQAVSTPEYVPPAPTPVSRPLPPAPANLPGTAPSAPSFISAPVAAHPVTPASSMRTMAKDMTEVKAGTYEQSSYVGPAAVIAPAPILHTVAPVMQASQPIAAPKTQNEQQLHEVLKQYGIDPYREPVE